MKKLILGVIVAAGLALAQAPYVGAHVGLFGESGGNAFNGGFHAGVGLQGGLEVRGGLDFSSIQGVGFTGLSADILMNLRMPGSPILPYGGLGGNIWFISQQIAGVHATLFGVHATLGAKYPISGIPLVAFAEVQPAYAFSQGGGTFVYYLKVGANYGF